MIRLRQAARAGGPALAWWRSSPRVTSWPRWGRFAFPRWPRSHRGVPPGGAGVPGRADQTGVLDIGKPQAGETVGVAAGSGAVGAAVGQIAKIKGARAVGIAGGKDKCDYVKKELGFDDCGLII